MLLPPLATINWAKLNDRFASISTSHFHTKDVIINLIDKLDLIQNKIFNVFNASWQNKYPLWTIILSILISTSNWKRTTNILPLDSKLPFRQQSLNKIHCWHLFVVESHFILYIDGIVKNFL